MITIRPTQQHKNESARSWVYRSILEAIVYFEIDPAAMLDTGDLQDIFKVSRTPIREAMIQLSRDGFVRLLPQRGSYVSPVDLDEVEKARFMRLCLEKEILAQACELCDDISCRELDYLLACQRDAMKGDDIRRQYDLDEKFHLVYYTLCGRDNIWTYMRSSNLHYLRLKILNIPMRGMKVFTYTHHEELSEALRRRDKAKAIAVIENHLNLDNWKVKELVEKNPEWFTSTSHKTAVEKGVSVTCRTIA